jgi:hypothetical protein
MASLHLPFFSTPLSSFPLLDLSSTLHSLRYPFLASISSFTCIISFAMAPLKTGITRALRSKVAGQSQLIQRGIAATAKTSNWTNSTTSTNRKPSSTPFPLSGTFYRQPQIVPWLIPPFQIFHEAHRYETSLHLNPASPTTTPTHLRRSSTTSLTLSQQRPLHTSQLYTTFFTPTPQNPPIGQNSHTPIPKNNTPATSSAKCPGSSTSSSSSGHPAKPRQFTTTLTRTA